MLRRPASARSRTVGELERVQRKQPSHGQPWSRARVLLPAPLLVVAASLRAGRRQQRRSAAVLHLSGQGRRAQRQRTHRQRTQRQRQCCSCSRPVRAASRSRVTARRSLACTAPRRWRLRGGACLQARRAAMRRRRRRRRRRRLLHRCAALHAPRRLCSTETPVYDGCAPATPVCLVTEGGYSCAHAASQCNLHPFAGLCGNLRASQAGESADFAHASPRFGRTWTWRSSRASTRSPRSPRTARARRAARDCWTPRPSRCLLRGRRPRSSSASHPHPHPHPRALAP